MEQLNCSAGQRAVSFAPAKEPVLKKAPFHMPNKDVYRHEFCISHHYGRVFGKKRLGYLNPYTIMRPESPRGQISA
jgi:hypothetical protein